MGKRRKEEEVLVHKTEVFERTIVRVISSYQANSKFL